MGEMNLAQELKWARPGIRVRVSVWVKLLVSRVIYDWKYSVLEWKLRKWIIYSSTRESAYRERVCKHWAVDRRIHPSAIVTRCKYCRQHWGVSIKRTEHREQINE